MSISLKKIKKNGKKSGNSLFLAREEERRVFDLTRIPSYTLRFPALLVPDRMFTNLSYSQLQLAIQSSSTSGHYIFTGNGAFDPDFSGTGHQPMGYDQYVGFYNRYRVHASTITVELLSSTLAVDMSIIPSTSSTTPTSIDNSYESPYVTTIPISSSVFRSVFSRRMSTRKIWGMNGITQDDLYQALFNANPTRTWFWHIFSVSNDGSTTATLRINVTITYEIEFYERLLVGQSINQKEKQKLIDRGLIDDVSKGSDLSGTLNMGESRPITKIKKVGNGVYEFSTLD